MEFKDYYQTMGVPPEASADHVRQAYRKLARQYHPDVSQEPDANWKAGQNFRPPPDSTTGFEFSGGA